CRGAITRGAQHPASDEGRAQPKPRPSSMKEASLADDSGILVYRLARAPRNRCVVRCDDPLRQSRRGLRRVEQADQPARVDEQLDESGASAIRRALTSRPEAAGPSLMIARV